MAMIKPHRSFKLTPRKDEGPYNWTLLLVAVIVTPLLLAGMANGINVGAWVVGGIWLVALAGMALALGMFVLAVLARLLR